MKTAHLHDIWSSPDNSRLVSKQFSFRLPVHIAAKIAALCDMYPQKNRTQIVADLLTAALDNLELNLPIEKGQGDTEEDEYYGRQHAEMEGYKFAPSFQMAGKRAEFRSLANKYYREHELELGNDSPQALYPVLWLAEEDFKK